MNIGFFIGKVISEIKFDFIIYSKNTAIAEFKIQLDKETIVKVKAYNKIADYCYSKLKIDDLIFIQGRIDFKGEIIIEKYPYKRIKRQNKVKLKMGDKICLMMKY